MKFRVIKFFPKDASIRGHRAKRSPQIFLPPVQIQNDKESNNHPFDLEFAEIPDRRIKKGGRGTSRRERIGTFLLSSVEMKIAAMIFKESPENGGETNSPTTAAFSPPNRENLRQ